MIMSMLFMNGMYLLYRPTYIRPFGCHDGFTGYLITYQKFTGLIVFLDPENHDVDTKITVV